MFRQTGPLGRLDKVLWPWFFQHEGRKEAGKESPPDPLQELVMVFPLIMMTGNLLLGFNPSGSQAHDSHSLTPYPQ